MKCSAKLGRIVAHKNTQVFHMTSRKQTVQGECFMNERQPNSPEHKNRSGWQHRDTRLQWLMWPSTQRIGKDIRANSYFLTRRADNVLPEACFTTMTEDRHDEPAPMDLSVISMNLTVISVWLFFHHSCFVLFCFWSRNLLIIWVLAVFGFFNRT